MEKYRAFRRWGCTSGVVAAQRTPKLQGTEAEAVAKAVGCARKLRQFFAADVVEQIKLRRAMRETTQSGAQKAHLAARVTMRAEQSQKDTKNVGIEAYGHGKRVGPRTRVEASVSDRQSERPRF